MRAFHLHTTQEAFDEVDQNDRGRCARGDGWRWCSRRAARAARARAAPPAVPPRAARAGSRARRRSRSAANSGGTLTVLNETDFEHLDPGIAYFSVDYQVVFATQRPLYSNKPNTATEMTPDMAAGPPEISSDNKTITVKLKEGIHFSPPVNREVTSEDVAYAIERGANPNVANPYIQSYFASIEGMPKATGGPIKGIDNAEQAHDRLPPDRTEGPARRRRAGDAADGGRAEVIRRKIRQEQAVRLRQLPGRDGPVHAQEQRRRQGARHRLHPGQVGDARAQPQLERSDRLPARLPERNPDQDRRHRLGHRAPGAGRLELVENDSQVAQSIIREAAEKYKSQLQISPGAGSHYIGVNNKVGPFTNVNLRKAFWAALDRAGDGQGARWLARHRRDDALHLPDDPRLRTGRWPEGPAGRLQHVPRRRTWRSPKSTSSWPATRAANTPAARRSRSSARAATRTNRTRKSSTRR